MAEPRRLSGHKGTVTCCIASQKRIALVATSGEDGSICWFDMRCKDVIFTFVAFQNPISSLCFKTENEDVIYASSGTEVKCFDVHLISCNSKSSFLASSDDSGGVKIIDIRQRCLYKTLRGGHTNICSSVQFLPWRPWAAITGGLDSKLVMWDFSKGSPYRVLDLGMIDSENVSLSSSISDVGQFVNPAFVHAIAVPDLDMLERTGKVCVYGRGDGIVEVTHTEPTKTKKDHKQLQNQQKRLRLDYSVGGHTACVSCVAFSLFGGEKGKFIISGGNDKVVKLWDLTTSTSGGIFCHDIRLTRKVNWLCTTPCSSENLVVCDTTKVAKVYTVS